MSDFAAQAKCNDKVDCKSGECCDESIDCSTSEACRESDCCEDGVKEGDQKKTQVRLAEVEIDNETTALNIMVQFLGLAQKRGAFTIDESAKIWECVKKFQRPQA